MESAFVIPFARLPRTLGGFDYKIPLSLKEKIIEGSIVQISLRNKKLWGFVEAIRPSRYPSLKPIIDVASPERIVRRQDRELIRWFSDYYCVSRGTAALQWAPFFQQPYKSLSVVSSWLYEPKENQKPTLLRAVFEKDKMAFVVDMIEYALGRHGQILILLPTISEVKRIAQQLKNSYPDLICIHSGLKTRVLRDQSIHASEGRAPIVIGTRLAVFTPLPALACIVLDGQERMEYKQYDANPRYDARDVALQRAKIEGIKMVFSSVAPRLEEMEEKHIFEEKKYGGSISCQIIGLEEEFRNKNYSFISDALRKKIEETVEKKKTVSLILNRTGYSRMVSCTTCQYVFSCEECKGIPRYSSSHAVLICSKCDLTSDIPAQCPACRGHDYTFPGLGIEKILSSIIKIFGEGIGSSLTVETSFAFQQREISNLGLLGFIACDPILSLSDFRSWERQWQSYGQCIQRGIAQSAEILIQAISPSNIFIQSLARLDYDAFTRAELLVRKKGNWPPYSQLIKIMPTSAGKKTAISFDALLEDIKSLQKNPAMPPYSVMPLSKKEKQTSWTEALIKIHSLHTPLTPLPVPLKEYIKKLPEGVIVDIDPVEI
ncbi:hypothetical protein HY621_00350 [Candidatus Uhrbacteria bacterium]|nr:hypothetical protein [Candidatus Uhrbacteria bacterium]